MNQNIKDGIDVLRLHWGWSVITIYKTWGENNPELCSKENLIYVQWVQYENF